MPVEEIRVPRNAARNTDINEASVTPYPHPVDLHLLREDSAGVGSADKVSANCNVEDDEEWSLKFGRAVDAARYIRLRILNPIDVPLDRSCGARNRKRVKARR